jgi:CO/xanthine dehydrogenase Mo-binding subunit
MVGTSTPGPDGVPKVRGEFTFSSDLQADRMLWDATVRSTHPHARITSVDIRAASEMDAVHSVLTHHDIPGSNRYGLEVRDQPVLAADVVRYPGEAVAVVAAEHPAVARRAAAAVVVGYEVLGLPLENVRLVLCGVGGAFGGKEDLSVHAHACLLALHTGRPVKMFYDRRSRSPGTGYGVSVKNVCTSLGYADYGTARVRLSVSGGEPVVHGPHRCGRGRPGSRDRAGADRQDRAGRRDSGRAAGRHRCWRRGRVVGIAADVDLGRRGAVGCAAVRERLLEMASGVFGEPVEMLRLEEGVVVSDRGGEPLLIADVLGTEAIEETREFRHRQTFSPRPDTGQGDGHVAYAFAAHRAVVDVDTELGLVRVVEIACAQDVERR